MLEQVCAHIHNYFTHDRYGNPFGRQCGTITITDGAIDETTLVSGSYFVVLGSRFNDGVHQYGVDDLTDETFTGEVLEMRPPRAFLQLVDEITDWLDKYGDAVNSPYQSEDVIGVYSYTKMTAGRTIGENLATWQTTFGTRLNQWRKIS